MISPKFKSIEIALLLAILVLVSGMACLFAQTETKAQTETNCRRVESITFVPEGWILRWSVSSGATRDGQYSPSGKVESYEIILHDAEMKHNGKTFQFSPQEAAAVQKLLMTLQMYTIDSVTWFEELQGPPQKAQTCSGDCRRIEALNVPALDQMSPFRRLLVPRPWAAASIPPYGDTRR